MPSFDSFVILAEMRTGSNFLEKNLNQLGGVTCHGEAFNPSFIGYPNSTDILGVTLDARDDDPEALLRSIREDTPGLGGFRYFHDHDPRIFDRIMQDRRCAKIVLTRNPADSYVSWKIAVATGQWKLTDARRRKAARATFDATEFAEHIARLTAQQARIQDALQRSGQAAFHINYDDLQSVDVLNGLAAFLGVDARLASLDKSLKPQNPAPLSEKVENWDDMCAALSELDPFCLSHIPSFEPRRGPAVPTWLGASGAGLLYMPIRSRLDGAVEAWLSGLGDGQVQRGGGQKVMRAWMGQHPGFVSFSVLRHPLSRAHEAFCDKILPPGPEGYTLIRRKLINRYGFELPDALTPDVYTLDDHRAAFSAFLGFLKANLADQTAVRVDALWASQLEVLRGFAEFVPPMHLVREAELPATLRTFATAVGVAPPDWQEPAPAAPYTLDQIYGPQLEAQAREIYARDYALLGFRDWAPAG